MTGSGEEDGNHMFFAPTSKRTAYWVMIASVIIALSSHYHILVAFLPHLMSNIDLGTVLAAIIGITGYIIDARTSRASEIRSLQVSRAQSQFAELLTPINVNFHSMYISLYGFLLAHHDRAFDQEPVWTSRDEVILKNASRWVWMEEGGLMQVEQVDKLAKRPAAVMRELPEKLVAAIAADPKLAAEYRRFIRTEWVVCVDAIADRIKEASHLIETIPSGRLKQLFGTGSPIGSSWEYTPRGLFLSWWLAYARGWTNVLSRWDDGDYSKLRPDVAFPVGLFFYTVEGQTIVGEIQKELTGHSAMHGSRGQNFHQSQAVQNHWKSVTDVTKPAP